MFKGFKQRFTRQKSDAPITEDVPTDRKKKTQEESKGVHFSSECSDGTELESEPEKFGNENKTREKQIMCDPCSARLITKVAVTVCPQCEHEWLCEDCSKNHKVLKATRFHLLIDADKFAKEEHKKTCFCDPCFARNLMKEAICVCPDCENEKLCEDCSSSHKVMKFTSSHILIEAKKYANESKKETMVCDPCNQRDKKREAVFVCPQCEHELLCKECGDHHQVMKLTSSHTLIFVEQYAFEKEKESVFCSPCIARDIKKKALYICLQCDDERLCDECSSTHKVMKSTQSHVLVEAEKHVKDRQKTQFMCEPCATRSMKKEALYCCPQCDDELLCKECFSNHKAMTITASHVPVSVDEYTHANQTQTQLCEPCTKRNRSIKADKFCPECSNELFCKECVETHTAFKFTSNHVLLDIRKYPKYDDLKKSCQLCLSSNSHQPAVCRCIQCKDVLCSDCLQQHKSTKETFTHTLLPLDDDTKQNKQKMSNTPDANALILAASQRQKPGKPTAIDIGLDTIEINWKKPEVCSEEGCYQISIRKSTNDSEWVVYDGQVKNDTQKLIKLKPGCEYFFRVRFVFGEYEGPYSDISDAIKTHSSPASRLEPFSVPQGKTGAPPTKKALPITAIRNARNNAAKTRKFEVGSHKGDGIIEKTIMLIGETGTGKSTLVDGMVNYILGVEWGDPFRFTVVNLEEEERERAENQAMSQTEWITCYTIHHAKGSRVPYTIHIIDTPGFGDTRGLDRDNAIVKQIHGLFTAKPPKGILMLDAVCFLIKAPDARLTAMQNYIFQAIMSLFGNDIEKNICSLITFADGDNPPVFAALDASNLPFGKRFTFNNSALYAKNTDLEEFALSPMYWEKGITSFKEFFYHLGTMQTKSMQLTIDVLNERSTLEATLNNLQPRLEAGLVHVNKVRDEIKCFEDNKSTIARNKQFTYNVKNVKQSKVDLPKGEHVTNCMKCNFTCHEKCMFADDKDKIKCSAMNADGHCKICPDKCIWSDHNNARYIIRYDVVEETRTYADMKAQYEQASGLILTQEQLLDRMRNELEDQTKTVESMIRVITNCNNRLSEIALRPNPLNVTDHIDLMIENEKHQKKNGYIERISSLNKLKERTKLLQVANKFSKEATCVLNAKSESESVKDLLQRIEKLF